MGREEDPEDLDSEGAGMRDEEQLLIVDPSRADRRPQTSAQNDIRVVLEIKVKGGTSKAGRPRAHPAIPGSLRVAITIPDSDIRIKTINCAPSTSSQLTAHGTHAHLNPAFHSMQNAIYVYVYVSGPSPLAPLPSSSRVPRFLISISVSYPLTFFHCPNPRVEAVPGTFPRSRRPRIATARYAVCRTKGAGRRMQDEGRRTQDASFVSLSLHFHATAMVFQSNPIQPHRQVPRRSLRLVALQIRDSDPWGMGTISRPRLTSESQEFEQI
ncbi:hypothetical protein EVG20_g9381 [Dentipellis fragilis]|uniref:Uncharacterized protein n=1 Tax=Dentipellis fragilis TaxID=205917 RepID=A0A4Y9Y012_9AGAM|nr:hypothetical protein EVG20_g9381 [Dentipellis fragilis]